MPRLDLIILPLLAGYIFLFTFNLTKFYNIRVDRQRLIFNSLLCTVFMYPSDQVHLVGLNNYSTVSKFRFL